MRVSCNGCRVLRKGCDRNCSIRPCLQWIQCPYSQANATFFLAKFYGRSALFNLINAAPEHLRPAIFRSLLYEACGRIVNPVYGSVGLLWSGSWSLCESAVEAVLSGAPVMQVGSEFAAEPGTGPPFKACVIRHLCRDRNAGPPNVVNRFRRRCRFKRRPVEPKAGEARTRSEDGTGHEELEDGSPSHESSLSNRFEANGERRETQLKAEAEFVPKPNEEAVREELELELTLGLEPTSRCRHVTRAQVSDPSCDVSEDGT